MKSDAGQQRSNCLIRITRRTERSSGGKLLRGGLLQSIRKRWTEGIEPAFHLAQRERPFRVEWVVPYGAKSRSSNGGLAPSSPIAWFLVRTTCPTIQFIVFPPGFGARGSPMCHFKQVSVEYESADGKLKNQHSWIHYVLLSSSTSPWGFCCQVNASFYRRIFPQRILAHAREIGLGNTVCNSLLQLEHAVPCAAGRPETAAFLVPLSTIERNAHPLGCHGGV